MIFFYIKKYKYNNIMIIPIRCFTCNQIIANKWNKYQEKIQEQYLKEDVTNNIKKRL